MNETIPGGKYANADGSGFHDAWGNPVADDVKVDVKEETKEEVIVEPKEEVKRHKRTQE